MKLKRKSFATGGLVLAVAALIGVAALSSASGSTSVAKTVKTGHVLGKTALVNRKSLTLYSLSAETRGRFICTGGCLSEWHPLVVRRGHKPTGAHSLDTIRRPDGRTQVRYKGKPLYTFDEDHKPGDAKGDGFKDVGVWHVAAVDAAAKQAPAAAPQPTTTSPGYGY